ncbi:Shedu immune nuclease family protein [Christiangramia sp. ASW11-125]|uniref:Shedu immune nuclease family protein n=1 Tax=Christiangramia sp. ASW11-125 TaxID=3400701 RepID=UPI003AAA71C3
MEEPFLETKKLKLFEDVKKGKRIVYRQHKEDENEEKVKIYEQTNSDYTFYFEGDQIKTIELKGYDEIPSIISEFGYGFQDNTLNRFFRYQFDDKRVNNIVISEVEQSGKKGKSLILNQSELEDLISSTNQEQRACNDTKKILIKNFLIEVFPQLDFDHKETNNNKKLILRNLNQKLIDQLTADDIEKIGEFYIDAAKKYKRADLVKRMSFGLQKNAQILTLQEIIKKYESLLKENPPESEWQKFFDEYITLFDSRYAHKINYKNIATGITKYPDLVLVDIYGYVDFYELKKSNTPLIKYDKSHKTWYWSKDVAMVISQASDYLQKAKENSISYTKAIKEETATEKEAGIDANIINPRVIIVAGSTKELNTAKKKHHFKNLRESLKDIEFILYDELLDRLKNLLDSVRIK